MISNIFKSKYIAKIIYTIKTTAFIFLMFAVLGPLEIYAGNRQEFEFGFHDFFWMFLGVYFVVWIVGSLFVSILPVKIYSFVAKLLLILGIELYLQNLFFNKQLIRPDGSSMQWDSLRRYTIFNTIVWIVIAVVLFSLSLLIKEKWKKASIYISYFICIIQIIAIISLIIQIPKNRVCEKECRIDATEQFALAEEDNIIVFILDRYANDQFNMNLDKHPEMKNVLKDFTYYNNANSIYETTSNALCVLLSGIVPKSIDDDKASIWNQESVSQFYDILHKHGYTTFISTRDSNNVFGNMKTLVGKYDNVKELNVEMDRGLLFRLFSKMTVYKYSPYIVKPKFEVMTYSFTDVIHPEGYTNSLYLNPEFYQALTKESFYIKEGTKKLFKVQHIQGMHGDYNMDDSALEIPESQGTVEQSRDGLNVIVEEYLVQLKELGLYDNATIIILADHGDTFHEFGLQPTVLIKRKGETHDSLEFNSAPISHADFVPTILSYLGEDYSEYGTSIYDWNEGEKRKRHVNLDSKIVEYYTDDEELEKKFRESER